MTAGRGRLDRVAASKSFWGPHPGEGLLTVRRAALHAGHLHLRSEGKELLQPLSDPVAQTREQEEKSSFLAGYVQCLSAKLPWPCLLRAW